MNQETTDARKEELRALVVQELEAAGWTVDVTGTLCPPEVQAKDELRQMHDAQRRERADSQRKLYARNAANLIDWFAEGHEVEPAAFSPRIVPVESSEWESDLFRFATLLWSVPVSQGYGRRMRFLVFDESNNKLVGLFALGDPVFNLGVRDHDIGWNSEQRKSRLYHVMDAYVLGAVPPYSDLLGGKFVALATVSDVVRQHFTKKYSGKTTIIEGKNKQASLALLTTTSALGRSSIYNRLQLPGERQRAFRSIGFSRGWGHFHISDITFNELRRWLRETQETSYADRHKYGNGPNWRLRTIRQALDQLGFAGDLLQHGIKREVFMAPLCSNYREFLCGTSSTPQYYDRQIGDLSEFFRQRWMLPRSVRVHKWREWTRNDVLAQIEQLTGLPAQLQLKI